MRSTRVAALIISLMASLPAQAEVAVQVVHSGDDSIGQRLAYFYKEALRNSSEFVVALDPQLGFRVRLITLDPTERETGYSTVYSAVWTWNNPEEPYDFYLTTVVGTCGSNRVKGCAEDLLVTTSQQFEKIRAILSQAK